MLGSLDLTWSELQTFATVVGALHVPDTARPSFPLAAFLLPVGHPMIDAFYDDALADKYFKASKKTSDTSNGTDAKWVLERNVPFVTCPRARSSKWCDPVAASNKWYDLLTARERECLRTKSAIGIADLSQTEKRDGNQSDAGCPCVTPHGVYWHMSHERLLTPIERCALQGVCIPRRLLAMFDAAFYNDMAGNGYCCPVLMSLVIGLLHVYSERFQSTTSATSSSDTVEPSNDSNIELDSMLCDGLSHIDEFMSECNDLLAECELPTSH